MKSFCPYVAAICLYFSFLLCFKVRKVDVLVQSENDYDFYEGYQRIFDDDINVSAPQNAHLPVLVM